MTPVARNLTTSRLSLRVPDAEDLSVYTAYCASDRSAFVRGPFDAAQAFDKLAAMIGHWALRGFGRYTIVLDGKPIGHVGPMAIEDPDAPELTWTIWDPTAEGFGYATEAAIAVRDHLFDGAGWSSLVIRVQPENQASLKVADRLGAELSNEPAPAWYPGSLTYYLKAQVPA